MWLKPPSRIYRETSIKSLSWESPLLPAQRLDPRLDPARLCGLRGLSDRHWTSAGLKVGFHANLSSQSPRSQPYLIRNDNILVILLGEDDTTCKLKGCSTNNLQKRIESLGFCPGWYLVPTVVPWDLAFPRFVSVIFSLQFFTFIFYLIFSIAKSFDRVSRPWRTLR